MAKGETKKAGSVLAGVLVIGDEILSGRTQDVNLGTIAAMMGDVGIEIAEARIVRDSRDEIVAAVNAMRVRYAYLFTTGGIGPTHDDITAESIAAAFGRAFARNAEAERVMAEHHARIGRELTAERLRMADMPEGAEIIANAVSGAPGFRVENVFVLAGVPLVCRAQLESLTPLLEGGARLRSLTLRAEGLAESEISADLRGLQGDFPDVRIGSYPYFREGSVGVRIVLRAHDSELLARAAGAVRALMESRGCGVIEEA